MNALRYHAGAFGTTPDAPARRRTPMVIEQAVRQALF
jgi:hypothetical protein